MALMLAIEIRSPGLLYGGLTIDSIRKKMVSVRRNELLAELRPPHTGAAFCMDT